MYKAAFSVRSLNDGGGQMIAARLIVVIENAAVLNKSTTLRVFRKTVR